jgi:RimJ/RimL family protein N-acetyltransferase
MISAEHAKFFTHDWSITIPGHPSVRYVHMQLSYLDEWLAMFTNPANRPHVKILRVWDQAEMKELRATTIKKHTTTQTKFDGLNIMVMVDGQLVGGANYNLLPTGEVNIGLLFDESARGKGLGKLTMQVLIQLGQRMGIQRMEAGTMKSNQAMQALMASLNIPGRDEIKEIPTRGVVAEILYDIPETVDWEINLQLEFGGPLAEKV